jgi:hypothetical protein
VVWGKWIRALGERGFLFDEGGEQVADGWIDAASAGCWMLDAGCWMLDVGYWMPWAKRFGGGM